MGKFSGTDHASRQWRREQADLSNDIRVRPRVARESQRLGKPTLERRQHLSPKIYYAKGTHSWKCCRSGSTKPRRGASNHAASGLRVGYSPIFRG